MTGVLYLILLFVIFSSQCDSARILGLFTAPSTSHILIHTAIIDALVEKGHEATVITTVPIPKPKNYRHLQLKVPGFSKDFISKAVNNPEPLYKRFGTLIRNVVTSANESLHQPEMKILMEKDTFDLVILGYFFNEFQLGVAAHFKCPVIISFMVQPIRIINDMVGNPKEMAYVPNLFLGGSQPLGFWGRVKNFLLINFFEEILFPLLSAGTQVAFYNEANYTFEHDKHQSREYKKFKFESISSVLTVIVLNSVDGADITMSLKTILSFVLVVLLFGQIESARILALFTTSPKSHLIIHSAITDALAEQGHNITIVTTIPLIRANPLYRHITLEAPRFPREYFVDTINKPQPFYKQFIDLTRIQNICVNSTLHNPAMRKLMEEETFDLVILGYFFNDFQLGVAAHFKCPVVVSFMVQPLRFLNEFVGNPLEVAYVPNLFIRAQQPMTFWERVKNFLMVEIFERILVELCITKQQQMFYNYNFPPDKYPSLDEMRKNISLVLANHHQISQGPIRPNVPAMVEIGGIQIKEKPDPLPEDIKTILDNAKHGAIYFSFGSNVQGDILDKAKSKAIFNVLSKLKETILWKWGESDFPGKASNIVYKSWLPQDDILAHPNVKLFITHGGQGSVVESEYHGVPMVGIPLFGEQHSNIANVEKSGFGLNVDFLTISEESFGGAVREVLSNNIYRDNVQRFAKLYKDRPMTAKKTAVYWVEYVLRHHGAPHMQSPAVHLNSFQLMSLDVIAFLLAVIYVMFKVLKFLFKFICCRRRKSKTE